jgi:catechol 2,3-dioxygenase-like lactoylglutathione lyase family enzyme
MEGLMDITALGYVGISSAKLDDWSALATGLLGMQQVDRAKAVRAFRMDDRKQRLFIDRTIEPGTQVFGWEVANAAALDSLAARLEAAGVAVKREPAALADQRCVAGLISFADPAGNRLEAFHGAHIADTAFKASRDVSGFRTGPQGNANAAGLSQPLDPCREVHPVAVEVAALGDYVAQRDADAQRDTRLVCLDRRTGKEQGFNHWSDPLRIDRPRPGTPVHRSLLSRLSASNEAVLRRCLFPEGGFCLHDRQRETGRVAAGHSCGRTLAVHRWL